MKTPLATSAAVVFVATGAAAGASLPDASTRSAASGQELLPSLLPALGVLAVLAVIGVLGISWVRRRLRNPSADADVPFTLEDLRRLRREGKLSEAEFARARQAMLDAAKRAMVRAEQTRAASRSQPIRLCTACGHPLRGLDSDRCPECGASVHHPPSTK